MRQAVLCLLLLMGAANAKARDIDSLQYYYRQATKPYEEGRYSEALPLLEKCRSLALGRSSVTETVFYLEMIEKLAVAKASTGAVDEAIVLQQEVVDNYQKRFADFGTIGVATSQLANYYFLKQDYDHAIEHGEQAATFLKRRYGTKSHTYAVNQNNLASYYSSRGSGPADYTMAVKLAEEALKHTDGNTPEYAYALNNIVIYYSQAENLNQANNLSKKAIDKGRKIFGRKDRKYADLLTIQSIRLTKAKNYSLATDYILEARNIYQSDTAAMHTMPYAHLLGQLGSICKQNERFDLGIEALQQARAIMQENNKANTQEYINCTNNLASLYRLKGNMDKADEITQQTKQLLTQTHEEGNYLFYGKALNEQAWFYASHGNFAKAIETESRADSVFVSHGDSINHAISLNDLSSHYANRGDINHAIELCEHSIKLLNNHRSQTTALGRSLNNLAVYYYRTSRQGLSLALAQQAVQEYEAVPDTASSIYAKVLGNLAMFYHLNDSTSKAIEISNRALRLQERILGENHPDLAVLYYNVANYYLQAHDIEHMSYYYNRAFFLQRRQVKNNFSHLPTRGRELYWNAKNYIFKVAPSFALFSNNNPQMVRDAYDAALFTKGILLNAEIDFRKFLQQTGQTELLEKYRQLARVNKRINDYYRSGYTNQKELLEIQEQATELEHNLVRECKEFGDFTSNLSITWEQVADSLPSDAAAIEFIDMGIQDNDHLYAALLLQPSQKEPVFIPLFTTQDLLKEQYAGMSFYEALTKQQGVNAIYNSPQVGKLVWKEIVERLDSKVRKLYFSPSGILYQVGVEYLQYGANTRIGDLYELHRLSSTKWLAQAKQKTPIRTAAVYGGLTYNMDPEEMATRHDEYQTKNEQLLLAENDAQNQRSLFDSNALAVDSITARGLRFSYLPGTMIEAEKVSEQLREHGITTSTYLRTQGTEESFKYLSGQGTSLIHIATHGFYFSESELKGYRQLVQLLSGNAGEFSTEDQSMNYSGLLMSGANTTLLGKRLPPNVENGILTAKEISQLDFRGLGLVVLSACQTGMGELKEDGVYGLQRAFKKAGAQTLLMSLWSVSDHATGIMMYEFYNAVTEGRSRYQAFRTAQQRIRDAGFSDPYYWASFIMLDDAE